MLMYILYTFSRSRQWDRSVLADAARAVSEAFRRRPGALQEVESRLPLDSWSHSADMVSGLVP